MGLAVMCAVIFGGIALAAGDLAPVELAVIALTPLAAFEPIQALPGAVTQWYRSHSAAQRVMTLLPAVSAESADPSPAAGARGGEGARCRPQSALIAARDLATGWNPSQPATTGVNFTVSAGESLAIVGPSGAGKTSLLLTIAGLLPPLAGSVRLNGADPRRWQDGKQRQEMVASSLEDAHIFHTTVLENLRVARGDVTAEQARAALAEVGLGDWLESLPAGLDTMLGSDATDISGGERRRLLIARTLLSRAQVLLIDEPTEHLDADTADDLVRDLLALARRGEGERAVVVVTHRHAPLDAADKVFQLRAAASAFVSLRARSFHDRRQPVSPHQRAPPRGRAGADRRTRTARPFAPLRRRRP